MTTNQTGSPNQKATPDDLAAVDRLFAAAAAAWPGYAAANGIRYREPVSVVAITPAGDVIVEWVSGSMWDETETTSKRMPLHHALDETRDR